MPVGRLWGMDGDGRASRVAELARAKHELCTLPNVGPATATDLLRLGIRTIEDLAVADPDDLHQRLTEMDGREHDRCVRDVFEAAIVHVRDGVTRPWWWYSRRRKGSAEASAAGSPPGTGPVAGTP